MSGDFPVHLATRLPELVGRRSAAVYSAARLSVCHVVLQVERARHAVGLLVADIARILVASSSSDMPDFLVTC